MWLKITVHTLKAHGCHRSMKISKEQNCSMAIKYVELNPKWHICANFTQTLQ